MTIPTIEQVVSRYLFNQAVPPANLKSDTLIRPEGAKGQAIEVDMNEFMTTGGGRFVGVERFRFVMNFLSGQDYPDHQLSPGVYTTRQLLDAYKIPEGNQVLGVSQYYQSPYDTDYAERAYVFGSGEYVINEDALFYVNQDGSREINNICVVPKDDNFDYEGGGPLADITNDLTKDQIDPSGIGRQVPIHFIGEVTQKQRFTDDDWDMLEMLRNKVELDELAAKASLVTNIGYFTGLFASVLGRLVANDIITYEDNEGRYVVYDGKDVNNNGTIDPLLLMNLTELIPYKGAAVIGGGGNDTIYGTGYSNDELYGGKGNDTLDGRMGADRMEGGFDDDTYIVDEERDEVIEKPDEGTDKVKADVNYTLSDHIEILELTGGDDIDGTGNSLDNAIYGNTGINTLWGEAGKDDISGGAGDDTLYGGNDADTLDGGEGADILEGGQGYDTYIAGDSDTIKDSDHRGRVHFGDTVLSYGYKKHGEDYYEGNGGKYTLSGGTLTFTDGSGTVTIESYSKSRASLGIRLEEEPPPEVPVASQDFSSPLVLDLNNNAVTSTSLFDTSTYFDLDGDGFKEHCGWIESGDGLLALDRDQSGSIESGNELFGNYTRDDTGSYAEHGFAALVRYDDNKDGIMDSKDAVYTSLRVWIDADSDGRSQSNELHSLESLHIQSINLHSQEVANLEEFNAISQQSTFSRQQQDANGDILVDAEGRPLTENIAVRDVWFNRDNEDTRYDFSGTIPPGIAALPEMRGSGRVKNLSHAMAEDNRLQTLVEGLLAAKGSNLQTLQAKADEILARWTHTDDIDPNQARGQQFVLNHNYANPGRNYVYRTYAYARDVAILESFDGKLFQMNVDGAMTDEVIGTAIAKQMADNYMELRDSVVIDLLSQSLFGKAVYDPQTGEIDRDMLYGQLAQKLQSTVPADKQAAVNLLAALLERDRLSVFAHLDAAILNDTTVRDTLGQSGITLNGDGNGNVSGTIDGKMYGGGGDDSLSGSGDLFGLGGNDALSGGSGHDNLYGGDGDDTLNGGAGDDMLYGDAGNDVLYSGFGYGHDVLIGGMGDDTLYGSGRSTSYVYHYGDGHDTLSDPGDVGTTPDVLSLRGIVRSDVNVVRENGDMLLFIRDIASDDPTAVSGSIRIKDGFAGGKIERFEFEDGVLDNKQLLEGSTVYDNIYRQTADKPTFVINDAGGTDTLIFAEGVTPAQLDVRITEENTIAIGVREDGIAFADLRSRITIKDNFLEGNRIERYRFADGTEYRFTEILALQQGTADDDYIRFSNGSGSHAVNGGSGNDIIITADSDDHLTGGIGADRLEGGAGNDVYCFDRGDGHDTLLDSLGTSDQLRFGEGITLDDLLIVKNGSAIIVGLKEDTKPIEELTDTISIENWYQQQNRLESFVFADGNSMNTSDILSRMSAGGIIYGLEGDDAIDCGVDDDVVFAAQGNDTIQGYEGADQLYGETGNDALDGGIGEDKLYGGSGSDTYIFHRGSGKDIIDDYATGPNGTNDTLLFGPGIDHGDLVVRQDGNDLEIGLIESGKLFNELSDQIRIHNWFAENSRIEWFSFADDTTLAAGTMLRYLGTDGDDTIIGLSTDSVFADSIGNDSFQGQSGSDQYRFGQGGGHDTITDSNGSDSLVFGPGISPEQVRITWQQGSNDILLNYGANGEHDVSLTNWYLEGKRIEQIVFDDGTIWTPAAVIDRMGTEIDDVYNGLAGKGNIIHSRGGDDIVSTFAQNDILFGGSGNDALDSREGNDTLAGEEGDDKLWGGAGDDTYLFNLGDGHDTLLDDDKYVQNAGNDRLCFGTGISREDLLFKIDPENNDLQVAVKNLAAPGTPFEDLANTITISNWYVAKNRIETFEFTESGEQMSVADIVLAMGTDGDDRIKALAEGSELDGREGNDILYGNDGDDSLRGGAGSDTLEGGNGSDSLTGGSGNDMLAGGAGNDTYRWGRGDGADTIYDLATQTYYQWGFVTTEQGYSRWGKKELQRSIDGGADTIIFGDSINPDDLQVKTVGNDVVIGIKENGKTFAELSDRLIITGFYNSDNRIETFQFADGSTLTPQNILNLMYTDDDDTVIYENDADQIVFARGGNDTVVTGGGADLITGGSGNDVLNGGHGNDIYMFTRGDGRDRIEDKGEGSWWQYSSGEDTVHLQGVTAGEVMIGWGGRMSGYYLDGEFCGSEYVADSSFEDHNNDLVIGLSEPGKDLHELSDRIVLKDWFNQGTKIETLLFDDGTSLDAQAILDAAFGESEDNIDLKHADLGYKLNSLGGDDTLLATDNEDMVRSGMGDDHVEGRGGKDTLFGGDGNDYLQGDYIPDYEAGEWFGAGDTMYGEGGDDSLIGAGGDDKLAGGAGNDDLQGGAGGDVYIYNRGDGTDTVLDSAGYVAKNSVIDRFGHTQQVDIRHDLHSGYDSVQFGAGITPDDVVFLWDYNVDENDNPVNRDRDIGSNDLIVALKDPNNPDTPPQDLQDRIIIKNWYYRPPQSEINIFAQQQNEGPGSGRFEYVNQVERFVFQDGTVLSGNSIIAAMSSERDDRIEAVADQSSVLAGLAGNDVLVGGEGNDYLDGGTGNDRLEAGYGNDIMNGGAGNDTYVITTENLPPWDGRTSTDIIEDSDGVDRIVFLNDIAREDIVFSVDGENNLKIAFGLEQQHQTLIVGNCVERFETSDGSFITREQVMSSFVAIAAMRGRDVREISSQEIHQDIDLKTVQYNSWTDAFIEHKGYENWNTFIGNAENEIVVGGSGEDELLGHSGNDELYGLTGDDNLNAGNGNDTYVFSRTGQNDTILDAENPLVQDDYGGDYGGGWDSSDYDGYGGDLWEIQANEAPSNDTLLLKEGIKKEDLSVYWAASPWMKNTDDLLIRVREESNTREADIQTILDHYSQMLSSYDPATGEYSQLFLNAADLTGHSDKALRQLAWQVTDGYDWIRTSSSYDTIIDFLTQEDTTAAYNREYRTDEDTILIKSFYNAAYSIENITVEATGQSLTNNDLMTLMSSDNSEMIRGVDWAENAIEAQAGNDMVVGGNLGDTIRGGLGSDLLNGRMGDDTYLFNLGDGRDVLRDGARMVSLITNNTGDWQGRGQWYGDYAGSTSQEGGYDRVVFGAGITIQNIGFAGYNYGDGIYVGYGDLVSADTGDDVSKSVGNALGFRFLIGNGNCAFTSGQKVYADDILLPEQNLCGREVEEFVLADGSSIAAADISAGITEGLGYIERNETFLQAIEASGRDARGYVDQILLHRWQRQDKEIGGTEGNDILSAGDGDDTVIAGSGNDTITGGFGLDLLFGGSGGDSYLYDRWDGSDTIFDAAGQDSLTLGHDLLITDFVASLDEANGNLTLGIIDEVEKRRTVAAGGIYDPSAETLGQKIVIGNFKSVGNRIESFSFSDGTIWSDKDLYNHFFATEGADILTGLDGDNIILSRGGNDAIALGDGNNFVTAGAGDDTIESGAGDDLYFFGQGDGTDRIHDRGGMDTLVLGQGNNRENIRLKLLDDTLTVSLADGSTAILQDWGLEANRIENIRFGDGSEKTIKSLLAPIVVEQENFLLQDVREFGGMISAVDPDGDPLNYTLLTGPAHGSFSVDGTGVWRYRAEGLFIGADTAVVTIDDGNGGVATTRLDFDVRVSPPTLADQALALEEDGILSDSLTVSNPVGGTLIYQIADAADHGQFNIDAAGQWSYTPAENYHGEDEVRVMVTNEYGLSSTATLAIVVAAVNDAPTVNVEEHYAVLGVPVLSGAIEADDIDGDSLYISIATHPIHGSLAIDNQGQWQYTPETGYFGHDFAEISVSDGVGGETRTNIRFLVNTYVGGDVTLPEDTAEVISLDDVSRADLEFKRDENSLVIDVRQKGSLRMEGYFSAPENGLKRIETIDGAINLEKDVIVDMEDWCSVVNGVCHGILGEKLLVSGTGCSDTLIGATNNDVLMGSGNGDFVMGLWGDDTIIGGSGNDCLYGNDGNDTLYGDQGADCLMGGSGQDYLVGGAGQDQLFGNAGNDILVGGLGNDSLAGGAGNDIFVFDTVLNGTTNNDRIADFAKGLDKIRLDKDIFTTLIDEGALSSAYFKSSATGISCDANDYFLYNTSSGALLYDMDGNGQGVAVQFATLANRPAISASDFLVAS